MNLPIVLAGALVFVAFVAHTFVGTREALSTRPASSVGSATARSGSVERNWAQSFCAFQLVTVDLLALSVLLFVVGGTTVVPARREIALASAGFFALWGIAWLGSLAALGRDRRDYLVLSQWVLWFVCAGLLLAGARTL